MVKTPRISIITPCFNHGKYINEMLESIYRQTFEDYEVIIVNDGSTDNTSQILNCITNENVKIIHTDNHGPSYARNLAIKNANAPTILNLDADDKIAPSYLEKAYGYFNSNPNIGIVYSDAEFFGAKSGKYDLKDYSVENMLFDNRIISQAFFKKDDWRLVGGYSDEFIYAIEDWDFWLSIIELGREVVKIPETLSYYRTYDKLEDSRTGRSIKDRIKMMETLVNIFHRHENLYYEYPAAWQHFSKLEKKLKNEPFLVRKLKNWYHNHLQAK